jgi:hypothetical protein
MSARYVFGKILELTGLVVVLMGLLAGLGLTPDGQASMGKEIMLLGIGGMLFTFGWFVERGSRA